ncbi:MAG: hypothetical protein ACW97P_02330 [Candidatus Hodarchaeales archaeon]|jgi:hypothetical protein
MHFLLPEKFLSPEFLITSLLNQLGSKVIFNNPTQTYIDSIISFIESIFPYTNGLAIIIANICVIIGGLTYLIDDRVYHGKQMILRSFFSLVLLTIVFSDSSFSVFADSELLESFESYYYFLLMYLLFILAALSLILFIASCGLYLIDPKSKCLTYMKKSIICLISVIVPMGMNFPSFLHIW